MSTDEATTHGHESDTMAGTPDEIVLAMLAAGDRLVDPDSGLPIGRKGTRTSRGYVVFGVRVRGRRKQIKVHRAVWLTVHGPIPSGLMPDHINRIKTDNRIDNLRLVDSKGNALNRRRYQGEDNPAARINRDIAERIRASHQQTHSYATTASAFAVSRSLVAQIVRRERWV